MTIASKLPLCNWTSENNGTSKSLIAKFYTMSPFLDESFSLETVVSIGLVAVAAQGK